MARISRKTPVIVETKYNVALYARLSVENSGYEDTNSIENQINILREYVKDKKDFVVIKEYVDNGFTGTNFNRPAFNRLMQDVKNRKIDTIIVKDLSRFGRNNIETEEYLGNIFPFLKVRFIAVTDGFDTFEDGYGNKFLVSSVKNMVNEMYAKDTARKVNASFDIKRKNGDYIGSLVPYGYKRDSNNKNKLVIDEDVADVVRLIFKMRCKGDSYLSIAKVLNDDKVTTPAMYREEKGICKARSNSKSIWRPESVKFILSNEVYIGSVVQSKTYKNNYGARKSLTNDNWCVVKNKHEAIIDLDTFYTVQDLNKNTNIKHKADFEKKAVSIENPFKGKLVCGVCGEKLLISREKSKNGKKYYYFYYCRMKKQKLNDCNNSRMSYDKIVNIFNLAVEKEITKLGSDIELIKINDKHLESDNKQTIQSKIDIKKLELEAYKSKSLATVVEFSQNLITEKEFKFNFDNLQAEINKLEKEIKKLEKEIKSIEKQSIQLNEVETKIKHIEILVKDKDNLTLLVDILVDKIVVLPNNDVEIVFNHKEIAQESEVVYE